MNYAVFVSIGVFAALFLFIASHFDATPKNISDFHPEKLANAIVEKHQKNIMIAEREHGVSLRKVAILDSSAGSRPILPNSIGGMKSPQENKESERVEETLANVPFSNGLYSLVKKMISEIYGGKETVSPPEK
jgi:hypothetical protein